MKVQNDCRISFGVCRALLAAVCVASIIGKTWAENNPVPQVLWHMEVEVDGVGKPISIESEEQAFEKSQGTFSFGPLKAGERVFYISVTLNVKETPVGKVYTGSVENNEKGTRIVKFNGPKFDCVSVDPAKASLYIPKGLGRRMRHFPVGGKGAGGINSFTTIETDIYPYSGLTMPWVALDTGNATYYAAAYDRKARVKSVGARWYSRRRQVDLRFRHPLSIRAGERWEMPEMVFEKVSGDWHDAAKRYRAWYDSTHPAVRSAAPDWTRDMVGLLLVIMRQQNELLMWPYTDIPKLCDVAERNGLDCIGLYGWTVGGHDHLYPDYDPDPKMGGVPALKAGIAEAHRRGIRLYIYANGQLQQVGATKFWDEYGKNFAITRRDGSPYIQTYHKYKDIPVYQFALACLYGAPWRERMFSLACQAESFGADAIIYDQMGAQRPFECWGRGHGHPTPWSAHAEERPAFLRGITDEIRKRNPSFSVFTEGVYDSILDSIGFSHSWTPGTFKKDALNVAARDEARPSKDGDTFPELFRYTFPEAVMTTRFPTPMAPRYMANYAAVFGLRHEIEIRYMPDRAYVLDGKVPTKEDYGTVRSKPDVDEMRATPPATASAYLKAVCGFQKRYAKYLLRGRFVDEEGFTIGRAGSPLPAANSLIAKRYVADDGTSAVCVWNISEKPVDVVIGGLGKPKGVYELADHATSAENPLPPDSLRLYVY